MSIAMRLYLDFILNKPHIYIGNLCIMKLTKSVQYSLYNFIKRRPQGVGTYLPLYHSNTFQNPESGELDSCLTTEQAKQRYKQYLPMALLTASGIVSPKSLVTKWEFNPQTETFRITTLRAQGLVTQEFRMDNIIPSTYPDMIAATRIPQPTYPVFLDSVMLYFNKFNDQTFLFEHDGTWINETVQHPKLSLQNTVDEKQWFDRRPIQ